MKRLILSELQELSARRPDGFYDEVVSRGRIETAEVLVLDDDVYREFQQKFAPPHPALEKGAGTELKKLLAKFGLKPDKNCKCAQHIREMNANGIDWCNQNISTIIGWLKEEAARANLPFFETGAKTLVKRAISNAKK